MKRPSSFLLDLTEAPLEEADTRGRGGCGSPGRLRRRTTRCDGASGAESALRERSASGPLFLWDPPGVGSCGADIDPRTATDVGDLYEIEGGPPWRSTAREVARAGGGNDLDKSTPEGIARGRKPAILNLLCMRKAAATGGCCRVRVRRSRGCLCRVVLLLLCLPSRCRDVRVPPRRPLKVIPKRDTRWLRRFAQAAIRSRRQEPVLIQARLPCDMSWPISRRTLSSAISSRQSASVTCACRPSILASVIRRIWSPTSRKSSSRRLRPTSRRAKAVRLRQKR